MHWCLNNIIMKYNYMIINIERVMNKISNEFFLIKIAFYLNLVVDLYSILIILY